MMCQFLHFVDLEGQEATRMGKISHLMEIFRKNRLSVENEKNQSIDEIMVPYKGAKAGSLKQYMPAKPNKWGFKLFARAGVSGMIYDFLVYDGVKTLNAITFDEDESHFSATAKTVLALMKTISTDDVIVHFDNYFSSLELLSFIKFKYNIRASGTIRSNRLLKTEILLPKKDREGTTSSYAMKKTSYI